MAEKEHNKDLLRRNIKHAILISFLLSVMVSTIMIRGQLELWSVFAIFYTTYLAVYGLYKYLTEGSGLRGIE